MRGDSYYGRDETLMQMREMAKYNEDHLKGNAYRYSSYSGEPADDRQRNGNKKIGGSFRLRLVLSLIIFGGFYWMHMENAPIMGYQTNEVVEAVSTDVGLQDLTNSVKINP